MAFCSNPEYSSENCSFLLLEKATNRPEHHTKVNRSQLQPNECFASSYKTRDVKRDDLIQSSCFPQNKEEDLELQSTVCNAHHSENVFGGSTLDKIKINQQRKQSQKRVASPGGTYDKSVENLSDLQMKEQQCVEKCALR